jgi:hypothetical protein
VGLGVVCASRRSLSSLSLLSRLMTCFGETDVLRAAQIFLIRLLFFWHRNAIVPSVLMPLCRHWSCIVLVDPNYECNLFSFCLLPSRIAIPTLPPGPPPPPIGRHTMAEGRAASSNNDANKKHREDPLTVLLTKVERTLQQLAVLEAEEQRRRPAKTLSPPAAPQPPARQAATSAFAFSQQHHNNKARVHPIEGPLPSVPSRTSYSLKLKGCPPKENHYSAENR